MVDECGGWGGGVEREGTGELTKASLDCVGVVEDADAVGPVLDDQRVDTELVTLGVDL